MKLIKKYKNRRLYDCEKSKYITIDDLRAYVLDQIPFKIEEASSAKDLTQVILLQVLIETQETASQFWSVDLLRQLIILVHHPMNQNMQDFLAQILANMEKMVKNNPYFADQQKWMNLFFSHLG